MFKKSKKEDNSNNKKEKKEKKNKVKLREKISLNFRRRYLIDGTRAFLIAFILLLLYAILNIWASKADLPKIDVTENQLYTLSDTSKKAISKYTSMDLKKIAILLI